MAKLVHLGIEGLRINETECAILALIVNRARAIRGLGCDYVELSRRDIAWCAGCSGQTTLRACQSLVEKSLVEMDGRFLESGGQIANAYRATALGIEVARLYGEMVHRCGSENESVADENA